MIKSREWKKAGFSFLQRAEWQGKGCHEPSLARDYLFYKEISKGNLGGRFLFSTEKEYIKDVITFIDFSFRDYHKEWLERIKLYLTVRKFSEWVQSGIPFDEILKWRVAGFSDPSIAKLWIKEAFDPHIASVWVQRGFDPRTAKAWIEKGFNPDVASTWLINGFDIDQASEWFKKGIDAQFARKSINEIDKSINEIEGLF